MQLDFDITIQASVFIQFCLNCLSFGFDQFDEDDYKNELKELC